MNVVIIGPGKVGAGFLAPLFADAGWAVTFAARSAERTRQIRSVHRYTATGVTAGPAHRRTTRRWVVDRPAAVTIGDRDFNRAVCDADLICTAVGVGNVPSLAAPLAEALAGRPVDQPVDVWVVENGDCAADLGEQVRRAAGGREASVRAVRFAGAITTTTVAQGSWDQSHPNFVGDNDRTVMIDGRGRRELLPAPAAVSFTDHYAAHLTAKLRVLNAGHAICAYLGWLRGHATIAEAIADPMLRPRVAGAMLESRKAVVAAHPVLGSDVHGPVADALTRFSNRAVADPVVRVGRDPIRKLARHDRLVGPLLGIRRTTGVVPPYFTLGIAAALLFDPPDDPQVQELQRLIREVGVSDALADISGLDPDDPCAVAIVDRYHSFILDGDDVIFPPTYGGSSERVPELWELIR